MNTNQAQFHPLSEKKLFIFDMDGTIYLGNQPFDFAIRFIKNLRKNGKQVLFFTNNASRNDGAYLEKLERLPELNKEELTELSDKVKEFNKNK